MNLENNGVVATQSVSQSFIKKRSSKNILLGITGSIAAYKTPDLVRRLKEVGYEVRIVMTAAACQFITPLTLQAVSGHRVVYDLLDPSHEAGMGHIELARWADLILIAPASANTLAKLSLGLADDLLSALCLARDSETTKIAVAPAMNRQMWRNISVQKHIATLTEYGVSILGPGSGSQACGEIGDGRMLEPLELRAEIDTLFDQEIPHILPNVQSDISERQLLFTQNIIDRIQGKTVLITAGPTREPIDPVRFITNRSSGKMGYALAEAFVTAGANVILISGPVTIPVPENVTLHLVESALEMHQYALKLAPVSDIFIATAAVADYRVSHVSDQKIKKTDDQNEMTLALTKNPDILKEVAMLSTHRPFCVGFAAETHNVIEYGRDKLIRKNLDLICINDVSSGQVFESDHNAVIILQADGQEFHLNHAPKSLIAAQILEVIANAQSL